MASKEDEGEAVGRGFERSRTSSSQNSKQGAGRGESMVAKLIREREAAAMAAAAAAAPSPKRQPASRGKAAAMQVSANAGANAERPPAVSPAPPTPSIIPTPPTPSIIPTSAMQPAVQPVVPAAATAGKAAVAAEAALDIPFGIGREFLPALVGIGVTFKRDKVRGCYVVRRIIEHGPAALHGGIREGDVFDKVDGVAVAAQSPEELTKLVLGAAGSRVALDILRNGEKS